MTSTYHCRIQKFHGPSYPHHAEDAGIPIHEKEFLLCVNWYLSPVQILIGTMSLAQVLSFLNEVRSKVHLKISRGWPESWIWQSQELQLPLLKVLCLKNSAWLPLPCSRSLQARLCPFQKPTHHQWPSSEKSGVSVSECSSLEEQFL